MEKGNGIFFYLPRLKYHAITTSNVWWSIRRKREENKCILDEDSPETISSQHFSNFHFFSSRFSIFAIADR